MARAAVIGLGFGDEGKGLVTDYVCETHPERNLVVRFSGGHQCGHRVVRGKKEHICSNFGSGVLQECPTYWSEFCTFEPVGFVREYNVLKKKKLNPMITLHPDCPITTPYDIKASQGKTTETREALHGTTGTGYYRTWERNKLLRITALDMEYPDIIMTKINAVAAFYDFEFSMDLKELGKALAVIKDLMKDGVVSIAESTERITTNDRNYVYEGSQGLLLDQKIGFYPHVTPSNIFLDNIYKMGHDVQDVYLVTRAYQTRHGRGPISNQDEELHLIDKDIKETNEKNEWQGEFRRTVLDSDMLKYACAQTIHRSKYEKVNKHLVVTCFDHVDPKYMYTFTKEKELIRCPSPKEFIYTLARILGINGKLHFSDGPTAKHIKEII